ncbi:GrpB family protein [Salirhabdus salicampi]|uniref:GrpB family protein n=1 Tax=Salirhabdus salicampi TaxID=476102 RepID=UPI0020C4EAF4|nr:GrpB family protein [Salirhabdus salicampi]MCP8615804.1 GrpB family protein [Salirhabdus salicampi]
MRKVEVIPYQENWRRKFEAEAHNLKSLFGTNSQNIYHIGSTSIPNMSAKPIIDILVEVKSLEQVDKQNNEMIKKGYKSFGEHGIPDRRFIIKGGVKRTHHIHVFPEGNMEIERHLSFRDYLISHPKEALQYCQLKEELAVRYPFDIDRYMKGKDSFIKSIDRRAKEWKREKVGSEKSFDK